MRMCVNERYGRRVTVSRAQGVSAMTGHGSSAGAFFEDPLYQFVTIDAAPVVLVFLFLLFQSFRLRKRAWDTPSKRFSRGLEICFVLQYTIICLGIWKRGGADGTGFVLLIVFFLSINFFMSAAATALTLQVIFPWLPESLKPRLQSKSATRSKVILEILALVMMISYNMSGILLAMLFEASVEFSVLKFFILMYYSLSILIVLLAIIFNVFCIFCVFMVVLKNHKKSQVKLFLSIAMVVIDCSVSITTFLVLFMTCFAHNACNGLLISNILCVSLFVILVSLLTFSRDLWWCNCRQSNSAPAAPNAATPLIRDREAEEQRTGLLTGSNSGSSTTSYNPLEMSDCSPNYKPLP